MLTDRIVGDRPVRLWEVSLHRHVYVDQQAILFGRHLVEARSRHACVGPTVHLDRLSIWRRRNFRRGGGRALAGGQEDASDYQQSPKDGSALILKFHGCYLIDFVVLAIGEMVRHWQR